MKVGDLKRALARVPDNIKVLVFQDEAWEPISVFYGTSAEGLDQDVFGIKLQHTEEYTKEVLAHTLRKPKPGKPSWVK